MQQKHFETPPGIDLDYCSRILSTFSLIYMNDDYLENQKTMMIMMMVVVAIMNQGKLQLSST